MTLLGRLDPAQHANRSQQSEVSGVFVFLEEQPTAVGRVWQTGRGAICLSV